MSESHAATDFRVRPMNLADLPQVVEIERRWASSPWSWATFENELKVPFSRALVAYRLGTPAIVSGYLVRWRVADEIHLLDLAVAESERSRGLGRMLLEALLEEARDERVRLVTLEVEETNEIARALYASAGFGEKRRRRDYYGTGRDAVVMEWMTPCRDVS